MSKKVICRRAAKMTLETSIDGFCVVGLDGRLLEVNSSLCKISGYSNEELLNMNISGIEAMETAEEIAQHIDTIIKQGYEVARFHKVLCDRIEKGRMDAISD